MARAGADRRAAVVGVGQTDLGRRPDRTSLQLQAEAAAAALADAGLDWADVDGLLTVPLGTDSWMMPCAIVASYLGLSPAYFGTVDLSGASGAAMVRQAVAAVEAGECETVLCVAGANLLSFSDRVDLVRHMAETGVAHPQFEVPHGPTMAALYGLIAQRHMFEYGTKPEHLAKVAVEARSHAAHNPRAFKRDPVTINDVLASRSVATPLHLLDCSVVCDGAGALVVTGVDRGRDLRTAPVHLLGHGFGLSHTHVGEARTITTTGAAVSGAQAFGRAGLTPADVDVAELYDCFTIAVLVELEDLGFCPKGEAGPFVAEGGIGLGGTLPVNTHGGLLSGGHPGLSGGFLHVIEAVRQLRGDGGSAQVPGAEVALAHGNGGVAGMHCTLILGAAGTA